MHCRGARLALKVQGLVMLETLDHFENAFSSAASVQEAASIALSLVGELGFNSFVYDYSPVALSHDGQLITPNHVSMLNVPDDMFELWCHGGLYQRDPVQHMSLQSSMPFIYSCQRNNNSTVLAQCMTEHHKPVVSYLHDVDMTCGISVPIQRIRGDLATCTAILRGSNANFETDANHVLAIFNLIGHVFHEHVYPLLNKEERTSNYVRLTPRERECLLLSSQGLTTKEIAHRFNRSEPTVTMHLQCAARKLGARNRLHAVVLANHYRLLAV